MARSILVPAAIFGKAHKPSAVPLSYGLMAAHPEVPAYAAERVLWVGRHFQWSARRGEPVLEPCFAFMPLDGPGRGLCLRLRDMGPDDRGRPRCLRVEAAYLRNIQRLAPITAIARLLMPSAWKTAPDPKSSQPTCHLSPCPNTTALEAQLEMLRINNPKQPAKYRWIISGQALLGIKGSASGNCSARTDASAFAWGTVSCP